MAVVAHHFDGAALDGAMDADVLTTGQADADRAGRFELSPGQDKDLSLGAYTPSSLDDAFRINLAGRDLLIRGTEGITLGVVVYSEAPASERRNLRVYLAGGHLKCEGLDGNGPRQTP